MGRFQTFIVFCALILGSVAHADWGLGVGTGGFQGEQSFFAAKDWNLKHTMELGAGFYPMNGKTETQINLGYRYSPFQIEIKHLTWSPVSVGLLAMYSLDDKNYFAKSPKKYPEADYYEQTGIRLGLEAGTQLMTWQNKLRLIYKMVILDTGLTALINNDGKYAEHFISAGIVLEFFF